MSFRIIFLLDFIHVFFGIQFCIRKPIWSKEPKKRCNQLENHHFTEFDDRIQYQNTQ